MPRRWYNRRSRTFNFKVEEICDLESLSLTSPHSCNIPSRCVECNIYTYDNIPIRKILVANINDKINHIQLKEKFAKYGEIVDCNLKKKSLTKSYAFITFKESQSADRAIYDGYNKNIQIKGMYLRVLPANSWHQPDRKEYTVNTKVIENGYFSNDASPFSKLNEHCLMHIFGFLPLRDRVRIERVCRYWQIISIQSSYTCPQFNSILNRDNWQYIKNVPTFYKILEKFGLHITKVNLSESVHFVWGNSTLIAIATLCPNIEEIDLSNFPFLASGIKALAKNCTKIKHIVIGRSLLELERTKFQCIDYNKELSAWFSKNRNIQYLHLKDHIITTDLCLKHLSTKHITHIVLTEQNCSLFTRIISKIQNLFSLDIEACDNINMLLQAQDFQLNAKNLKRLVMKENCLINNLIITDFLKSSNLTNLKYLDLHLTSIDDECLFTLGEKCNQLIHLNISGYANLSNRSLSWIISSLTKLEHLYMNQISNVTDEIFICGMPNLKTLSCIDCDSIRNEGLIQFIKNSEKLEKLDVRYCELIDYHNITEELISAAFESTKHRKNKLLIKSEFTCINKFMGAEEYLKEKIGIQFMGVKRHECVYVEESWFPYS